MRLNVITPCSRPVYLPIIACQLRSFTKFSIRWLVGFEATLNQETPVGHDFGHDFRCMFENAFQSASTFVIECFTRDPQTPSDTGTAQRNEGLNRTGEGEEWVAFLDDDTLLPCDYEDTITDAIAKYPDALGFIFQQRNNTGGLRMSVSPGERRSFVYNLPPYNETDGCDTGQMLFKRGLIADVRWDPLIRAQQAIAPDHHFYRQVVFGQNRVNDVRWLEVVASIHNALRT